MIHAVRRLLHGLVLLVAVASLSFLFVEASPGDYFAGLQLDPRISKETIAGLRAQYGADRPPLARYVTWLGLLVRGELGYSLAYHSEVAPLILPRARNTLLLTVTAMVLSWAAALLLGIATATVRGGWIDRIATAGITATVALPDIVVALLLLGAGVALAGLPAGGMTSIDHAGLTGAGRAGDVVRHMILPVAALVIGSLPLLVRHVRSAVVEVLDASYVRAARGLGIPRLRLLYRHVLPAAANPLISLFGLSFGTLLSGSLLVEVIMSWPGLGPMFLESILAHDVFVVIGTVILSTVLLVAGNALADLMLIAADPRIRR